MSEEQEREVAPKIEQERQVERPQYMTAKQQSGAPALVQLIQTGNLRPVGFLPAFLSLWNTSAAKLVDVSKFPKDLLAATNYARKLIILSPFEANQPLRQIMGSDYIILHLCAPRVNCSNAPLDMLDLYTLGRNFSTPEYIAFESPECILRSLIVRLDLFAVSLYLRSYEEYVELCQFL
ncbi:hypothetical protein P154DRAFT_594958 [Amniculicola lignicola CBS 123094]|uniref:Uncharacterized protein n=1 Tax=Amniculicola lignicola CBS 123094 TaxID=1392246 RepID=A0A6A5WME9_9PLEO|nr:hypothetical protein P154DRAFT_594958 [Amniculicola lignicola CBS 123094]